jgi:hypothetical protein
MATHCRKINASIKALKDAIPSYDSPTFAEEQLKKFNSYSSTAKLRFGHISKQLSYEDRAISDLEHYIEFSDNLDMYRSWLLVKNLRSRLRRRRDIKNEHSVLQSIVDGALTDKNISKVTKAGHSIEKLSYEPRELPGLFNH